MNHDSSHDQTTVLKSSQKLWLATQGQASQRSVMQEEGLASPHTQVSKILLNSHSFHSGDVPCCLHLLVRALSAQGHDVCPQRTCLNCQALPNFALGLLKMLAFSPNVVTLGLSVGVESVCPLS